MTKESNGVALVRLDRPKANALSVALLSELAEVAAGLQADPPGAVVVWGGERIFAAGAEISEFGGPSEARLIGAKFRTALDAIAALPRVTIAAVNGYALGGGCELALACDFRIAGSTARFGQPEILLGIIPGGGGTQRLARLIGASRAKDIILSGRQVAAAEALEIGLVNRVVEPEAVLESALEWAGLFARGPVLAHALAKEAVDAGLDLDLAGGLGLEQGLFSAVFETGDAAVGVKSFLESGPGKATFTGQ